MLFPETVKSLRQYIKNNSTKNGTIFYNRNVTRKTILDDISGMFKKWKEGLPENQFKIIENVTHKYFRRSLRTAAKKAKCHIEYIKLVMGRKLEGTEENYTEKDAIMTSEVIQAVYDNYFSQKEM